MPDLDPRALNRSVIIRVDKSPLVSVTEDPFGWQVTLSLERANDVLVQLANEINSAAADAARVGDKLKP